LYYGFFSKKNIEDKIEEAKKTVEPSKESGVKTFITEPKPAKRIVAEEDDLEIPAFIRRKMK